MHVNDHPGGVGEGEDTERPHGAGQPDEGVLLALEDTTRSDLADSLGGTSSVTVVVPTAGCLATCGSDKR